MPDLGTDCAALAVVTALGPLSPLDAAFNAFEMTETLRRDRPDLVGPFTSDGGLGGALAALGESGRADEILTIGCGLMEMA